MARDATPIVIVHGAWVGAWRWRKVANELTDRGYRVFTPTLTGLGERQHLTSPAVNLSMHARDVANVIKYEELKNVTLVGHSYGGMPISAATELVPEGVIQSIMYMDAFFPEDGEALNDLVSHAPHLPSDANDYLVPPPTNQALNAHLDEAARKALEARRSPQSVYCFSEKAKLTGARERIAKKAYVLCTGYDNKNFTPMAERVRAKPDWRVAELPYTHDLQNVAVTETADMIETAIP
jgi:pimeloyl-ACP methyl ester carboxylesterase